MKVIKFGSFISCEREKLGVSIEKLAKGLCSVSVLRRIESGERDIDYFLLSRLLERLGISGNKTEILQNRSDYELMILREYIGDSLIKKEYERVKEILSVYEGKINNSLSLHKQFIYLVRAILASDKEKNIRLSNEYIHKAIELSLPDFDIKKIEQYLLSEEEIILIIFSLKNEFEEGKSEIGIYGEEILKYVDRHFRDEELKSDLYGRIAWTVGEVFIHEKKFEEALMVSLEAKNRLTENGLLMNLPQFLDRILLLSENRNKSIYIEHKEMRDALKNLYEAYGFRWGMEEVNLLMNYKKKNISLISEIVKQERLLRNYSQLELSEILGVDIKTVSRVESGKVLPKTGTLEKIFNFFQMDMEAIETRIITNDFYLIEQEREVSKLMTNQKFNEAEKIYHDIKGRLSLRYKKNKQYIEMMDSLFDWLMKRKSPEETMERLMEAFHITRGEYGMERLGEFTLSRMEAIIMNSISICYKQMGRGEKSIELLEKVIVSFEKSKVDMRFRYVPLCLIFTNLCTSYEEADRFEDAIALINKSISYAIKCMRGEQLGFLLEQKTYTMDRMTGRREGSRSLYRQSNQIKKLMKVSEIKRKPLKDAFKKWYGEEIDAKVNQ